MGIAVDEVTEVITIPLANIKPPPHVAQGVDAAYLLGVCLAQDSLIMLLNPDLLLTGYESAQLVNMKEMIVES
jgi:purine-binding chemotaxis protein CheW